MKNSLIVLTLILPILSFAQCPVGSVSLSSQADIDDFVATYPNCTQIDGNLTIGTYPILFDADEALDLSGLSTITSLSGTLKIYNTSGPEVDGIAQLGSLDGLQNISAARSLIVGVPAGISGGFHIPYQSLVPLNSLAGELDSLFLTRVIVEEPLPPFENIEEIGYCRFEYMKGVESTPSFPALTYLGDFTVIGQQMLDDTLSTVVVPAQLTAIGTNPDSFNWPFGGIFIQNNAGATEIIGGENLTYIQTGAFSLNRELTDMSAFDNVSIVGGNGLFISSCQPEIFDSFGNLATVEFDGVVDLGFALMGDCNEEIFESVDFAVSSNLADGTETSYGLLIAADQVNNISISGNFTNLKRLDLSSQLANEIIGFATLDSIVEGRLNFFAPGVSQLPNFENLVHVEGDVELRINQADWVLEDLSGLSSLMTIGEDLSIGLGGGGSGGEAFLSLSGLENLTQVGGRLQIKRLVGLTDISALSNLVSAQVFELDRLESLSVAADLESLESVVDITVSETNLTAMPNFPLITTLSGDLEVEDNALLEFLGGLDNVQSMSGDIIVSGNPELASFDLPVDIQFTGTIDIQNNPSLENCGNSASLCNLVSQAQPLFSIFADNGALCNDSEAILTACLTSTDDLSSGLEVSAFFSAYALMISSNQYIESGSVHLYSVEGKRVFSQSVSLQSGENRFRIPSLSSGVYLLSIENADTSYRTKVFMNQR